MKLRSLLWTALLALLMTFGPAGRALGFPVTERDDRNKEVRLENKPLRIISLGPTPTELLFALGLEQEVIGVSRYCDYPEEARKKEKVGGFLDVDREKIVALQPDLILAFGTLQVPVAEELEKRGFTVFLLYPRSVKDILASFTRVARITGAEKKAAELTASVKKELAALESGMAALPQAQRLTVFRVMSFNTRATIGADSFQSDLFFHAGGRNAFPAAGRDYFELTADELAKGDPDVVLICGDDGKDLKQMLANSRLYKDLRAVRNGSVLVMPCELTCRPGPRIAEAAKGLASFLREMNQKKEKKGQQAGR